MNVNQASSNCGQPASENNDGSKASVFKMGRSISVFDKVKKFFSDLVKAVSDFFKPLFERVVSFLSFSERKTHGSPKRDAGNKSREKTVEESPVQVQNDSIQPSQAEKPESDQSKIPLTVKPKKPKQVRFAKEVDVLTIDDQEPAVKQRYKVKLKSAPCQSYTRYSGPSLSEVFFECQKEKSREVVKFTFTNEQVLRYKYDSQSILEGNFKSHINEENYPSLFIDLIKRYLQKFDVNPKENIEELAKKISAKKSVDTDFRNYIIFFHNWLKVRDIIEMGTKSDEYFSDARKNNNDLEHCYLQCIVGFGDYFGDFMKCVARHGEEIIDTYQSYF